MAAIREVRGALFPRFAVGVGESISAFFRFSILMVGSAEKCSRMRGADAEMGKPVRPSRREGCDLLGTKIVTAEMS